MAAKAQPFGFPAREPALPPRRLIAVIRRRQNVSLFLASALAGSVVANVILGGTMLRRADVEAYASDGSLYGCRLKESGAPPAAPAEDDGREIEMGK